MWGEDGGAVVGEGGNRCSCTVVGARRGQASGHSLFRGKFRWSNQSQTRFALQLWLAFFYFVLISLYGSRVHRVYFWTPRFRCTMRFNVPSDSAPRSPIFDWGPHCRARLPSH